jgi:signal peptidase I
MSTNSVTRFIVETLVLIVLAFLLAQGIKLFLVQPYLVPTGSMIPTIEIRDRVLANKLPFWFGAQPKQGDIVVIEDPTEEFPQLIKRVIATEGQTIDLRDGKVYLDGQQLDEEYAHGLPTVILGAAVDFPFTVPAGDIFVMGDNRTNSADSRVFGSVSTDTVRGRGFWTYWPFSRFGPLK